MKKIIIAVDGYSSCGKSTFARMIACALGYVFIDTGAMYRAVTLYAIREGLFRGDMLDEKKLTDALDDIRLHFCYNPSKGKSDIYLNGVNVEEDIRNIAVSNKVSRVSGIPQVREKMVELQQRMGDEKGIVMDGRDIGTVVFPQAELKLFMTADLTIRAQRRYKELTERGQHVTLEEIKENIRARDDADENRAVSPLRKADDAIVLDNSHMTVDEQMEWLANILHKSGVEMPRKAEAACMKDSSKSNTA